jgi:tocopherol O-methyltransferase
MLADAAASTLVELIRNPQTRSAAVVNEYYTRCIPYYRDLLGDHWHTGHYRADDRPVGLEDQLRMERVIASSAGVDRDCRALDVGCGIGGPACHLARLAGARVHGITPNAAQLEMARRLATETGVADRVTFALGFATELPCEDASFDVVLFFESPCHFPDRPRFFREAYRVLRDGGRLAGEDWLAAEGLGQADRERHIEPVCRSWAIPELGTLGDYASGMEVAGFRVAEAVDLRGEMSLLRGFLVDPRDRQDVAGELRAQRDPIRRLILEGLLHLGAAAAAGAFTLGRFLARKEMSSKGARQPVVSASK